MQLKVRNHVNLYASTQQLISSKCLRRAFIYISAQISYNLFRALLLSAFWFFLEASILVRLHILASHAHCIRIFFSLSPPIKLIVRMTLHIPDYFTTSVFSSHGLLKKNPCPHPCTHTYFIISFKSLLPYI